MDSDLEVVREWCEWLLVKGHFRGDKRMSALARLMLEATESPIYQWGRGYTVLGIPLEAVARCAKEIRGE